MKTILNQIQNCDGFVKEPKHRCFVLSVPISKHQSYRKHGGHVYYQISHKNLTNLNKLITAIQSGLKLKSKLKDTAIHFKLF